MVEDKIRFMKTKSQTKPLKELRNKYPVFSYDRFDWKIKNNDLVITYKFSIKPDISFSPTVIFKNVPQKNLDKDSLENFIFNLGLAEIPTYWKTTCSPEIVIKTGQLTIGQMNWWQREILKGMGEFFYINKIDFTKPNFLKVKNEPNPKAKKYNARALKPRNRVIVPVGGGKDSVVTLNILKDKFDLNALILNTNTLAPKPARSALETSETAGYKNPIVIERSLDKKLFDLNNGGFLNGHTPFSLYLAFASTLAAALFGYKYIALSNESSADEETVIYLDQKINHQYSKSFEFEKNFDRYRRKYLAQDVFFFSILRPLHEIQIAKLFSNYTIFYPIFKSCNVGQKDNIWCGKCAKCLFAFTMIYPFVSTEKIVKIFSYNLFENKDLLPILKSLLGQTEHKPFDCVGTKEETTAALYLSYLKEKKSKLPLLLDFFEKEVLPKNPNLEKTAHKLLKSWNINNLLPHKFAKVIKREIRKNV